MKNEIKERIFILATKKSQEQHIALEFSSWELGVWNLSWEKQIMIDNIKEEMK